MILRSVCAWQYKMTSNMLYFLRILQTLGVNYLENWIYIYIPDFKSLSSKTVHTTQQMLHFNLFVFFKTLLPGCVFIILKPRSLQFWPSQCSEAHHWWLTVWLELTSLWCYLVQIELENYLLKCTPALCQRKKESTKKLANIILEISFPNNLLLKGKMYCDLLCCLPKISKWLLAFSNWQ